MSVSEYGDCQVMENMTATSGVALTQAQEIYTQRRRRLNMYRSIVRFMDSEDGATAIEYAMIAAATGLAIAVFMPGIGEKLQALLAPLGIGLAAT